MTRVAGTAFAVLVLATVGAFFAAQELKSTPPVVQELNVTPIFSPNQDGRSDRARASFVLDRRDDVTASVVNRDGDEIRELVRNRELGAEERLRLAWDGTDDDGELVADGTYRVRLNLRRQGRSVTLPRNIVKDTRPPAVRVLSIGPEADTVPRPELLPRPDGQPARVTFRAPRSSRSRKEVQVFRTDVRPPRPVFDEPIALADDERQWSWDGTANGRRVAAGTYIVVLRGRDRAGNIGASSPIPPRQRFGETLPGRGGITVRYLTAQAPTDPVTAGEQVAMAVDSVDENFSWTVRRVGEREVRSRGSGTRSRIVRFRAPRGKSGLYLFEVRTRTRKTAAPFVVQATEPRDVLVVVPLTTWQGRNPRDDDGDGLPNTLDAGLPVDLGRPFVRDGLPAQLPRNEALFLAHLDRAGRRYDITTDAALARRGVGPQIAGHRGVVIPGDARWLDGGVARTLRAYVRGGGRVLSIGTRSLRRNVRITSGGRAIEPTQPTTRDLFGARLRPLTRAPTTLVGVLDEIGLFEGTEGQFTGLSAFEQTADVGGTGTLVASAATQDGERDVIVAARVGGGLVIRPGLPELSRRLGDDLELQRLVARSWTLLGRR